MRLILASTSPFRRELLHKLGLDFDVDTPDIDESMQKNETPEALVRRLAEEKARAVAARHADAMVIGSDQAACIGTNILGKPGSRDRAIAQLSEASGKLVTFYTGLCLFNSSNGNLQIICEPFHVYFRNLSREQIERYLDAEEPYNCAGSFKSEGLGISLFEKMDGDDPNALIGLPLIRLVTMLQQEGISVP